MRILLTNDDGIYAPGLRALRKALRKFGEVTVVAPESEQSAAGHSITLLHPLVVQEVRENGEYLGFAVNGKPADCVKLGLVALVDNPPDLIISGINAGSNAGINVLYSGTVAAAVEGAFFHTTAIAVSLELPEVTHYKRAAEIAVKVIGDILAQKPKQGELFNINIPYLGEHDPLGVRVVRQGLSFYKESYEARTDPRGRRYYWLLPDQLKDDSSLETDVASMANGYVTVTPLHFDLTAHDRLHEMKQWAWTFGEPPPANP